MKTRTITALMAVSFCLLAFLSPDVLAENISENSWVEKRSMPVKGSTSAVTLNDKIYVLASTRLYEYNPKTNRWSEKTPLPTARTSYAVAACENKLYVIGGSVGTDNAGSSITTGINEVYDPETDTWETKTEMPTKRAQMNAETVNGKIYVVSGRTAGPKSSVTVNEEYDPVTDSWTTRQPIPYTVASYASAVLDNKLYVIGGQNEFCEKDEPMNAGYTQIYDPQTDAWIQGTPIPNPVWVSPEGVATTGTYAPKRIYVIGGEQSFASASRVNYAYDPQINNWTRAAPMETARFGHSLAVVNDLVYAIGGIVGWLQSTSSVEQYTPREFGTIPTVIKIVSPETLTYVSNEVSLDFTVNKPVEWIGYCLDCRRNFTVITNSTLERLSDGEHNITVYGKDMIDTMWASETVHFTVDATPPEIL
ncbi:MAG: hypothetical protein CW716_03335, partial [Candidatus Bathyarchaeum sp.]